jgi:hypothetical protein
MKPGWLRDLEEEQSARMIRENRAGELASSQQRILADNGPELWKKIKAAIEEAVASCELRGVTVKAESISDTSLRVATTRQAAERKVVCIDFMPEKHKLRTIDSNQRDVLTELFFTVRSGAVVLSDGQQEISTEADGVVGVACQRLLEPLLRPYA